MKKYLNSLYFVTGIVGLVFLLLLFKLPKIDIGQHLLEFFQELLALGLLVVLFESYHQAKSAKERSHHVRHAMAWLLNPNDLQLEAEKWVSTFRNKRTVPNQAMPFQEISSFYYRIVLLAMEMPDFTEFSQELKSLKDALDVSREWDEFREIRVGSTVGYSEQAEPLLKKVEGAAANLKAVWLRYEINVITGSI